MGTGTLEERVAALEAQVSQLLADRKKNRPKDWRRTLGMFTGDEIMREICDLALQYREEDRRQWRSQQEAEGAQE